MQKRSVLLGIVLALAVLVALVAWRVWRQKQEQAMLFERLPGENLLLAYVDVERLRHAALFSPALRAQVDPDPDYTNFVKQTGFDYQRDLDAAAACYLPDRVYILAWGRFDAGKLRQYALGQGGNCEGARLERPCSMPGSRPGRIISFELLSPHVLALATAPEPGAVRKLESAPAASAEPLAREAKATDAAALLWVTATPAGLDRALSGAADLSPNVALFSRALAGAQRAYVLLLDRSPNLQVSLRAICSSEAQAGEMRRLLQGLNDLVGGLLRGPRGGAPAGWTKVLASASIEQRQNAVQATWTLDVKLLEDMAAGKSD